MSTNEPLYQIGICPSCPSTATQRFLFATDNRYGPIAELGRIIAFEQAETLSLFRCERCEKNLLFQTESFGPSGVSIEELDLFDPDEIAQIDPDTFLEISTLVWPTSLSERKLSGIVPSKISQCYQTALKVRSEPNSFAVQIRRALEAICIDQGESGKNLSQDLKRLSAAAVFPPMVAEIAHELKEIGNTGAHVKSGDVEAQQVQAIDDFFHLVIDYVYMAPARLQTYRKLLAPITVEIPLNESVN